jgi:putative ABC transport system permease protein
MAPANFFDRQRTSGVSKTYRTIAATISNTLIVKYLSNWHFLGSFFRMLKNFIRVTLRNLWRNKGISAINLAGLSIGMAAAILILLWVHNEMSYDRFHVKTDRIALLYSRDVNNGQLDVWPRTSSLIAPVLKKDYPEIEDAIRFRNVFFLTSTGDKHFNPRGAFADSGFLSVFSFPLLEGNAKTALNDNHAIVLTQELATRLFGNQDPMGRLVKIDSTDNFTVTGVLGDLPANTEIQFEYLLPWSYITKLGWDANASWTNPNTGTYVLLKPGASWAALDIKLKNLVKSHVNTGDGSTRETFAQPLSRVHLYSRPQNGQLVAGLMVTVRLFALIALFILLIACINFMNLSTARSEKRAREVGIKKVVGAMKSSLILQFIGESILLSTVAFGVALAIVQLSLKSFDEVVGSPLALDFTNPWFWLYALLFVLFTGILAGSYPAFYLSSARPVKVLKGGPKNGHALVTPRKILVVLQFSFAVTLICSTIVVWRQIKYVQQRDTGYNKTGLVFTFSQGNVSLHYDLIKQALLSNGAATAVTRTFSPITRSWGNINGLSWPGSSPADKKTNFLQYESESDFVKTTGTTLLEGRDIDTRNYPTDSTALLLNETAVRTMRLKDPLGKVVQNQIGQNCHVIGVIRDFIIESPYDAVRPMVIQGPSQAGPYWVVHFKLNSSHTVAEDLALAEKVFKKYNPGYPFEYYFADQEYTAKFQVQQRQGTLAALFAGLTIFISCLGLFGLAACMAENRIKEIGVRKVLGASVGGIAALLSRDFLKLVLISILIASPLAWYIMNNWLQDFNYRLEVSVWIFLDAGLLAILIAALTVSYQAIKAAMANPVKSLRSE